MSKKAGLVSKEGSRKKTGAPLRHASSSAHHSSLLLPPPPPPSSSSAFTLPPTSTHAPRAPSSSADVSKASRPNANVPPPTSSSSVGSTASSDDGGAPRKLLRKRPSAAVSGGLTMRNGEGKAASTTVPMLDEAVVLRDLLAWDLLSAVDAQRTGGRRSPPPPPPATPSSSGASSHGLSAVPTAQASLVREQFDSVAQYRSLWLRLVQRETRAVVLNQVEREGCEGGPAMTIDAQEFAQQQPGEPLLRLRVTLANRCFGDGRNVLPGCTADHLVWLVPEGPSASRALASLQVPLQDPPPIPGQNLAGAAKGKSSGSGLASHQVAAARAQARRAEREQAAATLAAGGPAGTTSSSSSSRPSVGAPPMPPQGLLALFSTRQFPMEVRVAAPAWRRFQSSMGSSGSVGSGVSSGSSSGGGNARLTARRVVAIPVASAVSSLRELKALCRLQDLHPRLLGAVLAPEAELSRKSSEQYGIGGGGGGGGEERGLVGEAPGATAAGEELQLPTPPPPYSPPYSPVLQRPKPNTGSDLDAGSSSSSSSSGSELCVKEPERELAWQREIDDMNIGPGFADYLDNAFNASQRRAILAAARAVAMPESSKSRRRSLAALPASSSSSGSSLKILPRHSTASSNHGIDFAVSPIQSSSSSSLPPPQPERTPQVPVFTLIKGPPGTGKTTTLKGLLNLLHVREYSRYYDQVVAQELKRARQTLADISSSSSSSGGSKATKEGASQPPLSSAVAAAMAEAVPGSSTNSTSTSDTVRKPRLLVAAPSNVAVDNVLAKVIADGFLDGAGQRYNPRIVRVGRGQGPGVREVSMETLVEAIGVRDERAIAAELQQRQEKQQQVKREYGQAHRILVALLKGCDLASSSGGLPPHWEVRADPTSATPYFVNHAAKTTSLKPPGSSQGKAKATQKDHRTAASAAPTPPPVVSVEAQNRVGTPAEAAAKAKATAAKKAAQAKAQAQSAQTAASAPGLVVQDPEALAAALKRSDPSQQPEYSATLNALVQHREKLEKLRLEIKQRVFALDALTAGRSDAALGNRGNGGTINSGQRHALQLALEANILDEAHVVFTTLNSAAAESFRTTDPFAVCVIDEAAQATEPALLAPLLSGRTGAPRCVLVGDPQQLRATAFSVSSGAALGAQPLAAGLANFEEAHHTPSKSTATAPAAAAPATGAVTAEKADIKASSSSSSSSLSMSKDLSVAEQEDLMLSRSLFERLETAGHFVHLLDTQYRMHPSISAFPRHVFYSGALKDAASVGPPNPNYVELFHAQFPPFLFLDVLPSLPSSSGSSGGGSTGAASTSTRSNPREAAVLLQCYLEMKQVSSMSSKPLPGRVGVLTPYREQLKVLERVFDRAGVLQEVELHTVDGYQGREKDVILVSTARAPQPGRASKASSSSSSSAGSGGGSGGGGGGGVGFLADTRRMNVALTRAKTCLVVCGSAQALQVDPHWKALVNMATRQKVCTQVPSRGDPQSLNLAGLVAATAAGDGNQQQQQPSERKTTKAQKGKVKVGGSQKGNHRPPPPPPPPPRPPPPPPPPPSSYAQYLQGLESQPPLLLPSYAATHFPGGPSAPPGPAPEAPVVESRPEKRPRPPSPDEEGEVSDNDNENNARGVASVDASSSGVSGSFWFDTAGNNATGTPAGSNESSDMSCSDEEVIGFGGASHEDPSD